MGRDVGGLSLSKGSSGIISTTIICFWSNSTTLVIVQYLLVILGYVFAHIIHTLNPKEKAVTFPTHLYPRRKDMMGVLNPANLTLVVDFSLEWLMGLNRGIDQHLQISKMRFGSKI